MRERLTVRLPLKRKGAPDSSPLGPSPATATTASAVHLSAATPIPLLYTPIDPASVPLPPVLLPSPEAVITVLPPPAQRYSMPPPPQLIPPPLPPSLPPPLPLPQAPSPPLAKPHPPLHVPPFRESPPAFPPLQPQQQPVQKLTNAERLAAAAARDPEGMAPAPKARERKKARRIKKEDAATVATPTARPMNPAELPHSVPVTTIKAPSRLASPPATSAEILPPLVAEGFPGLLAGALTGQQGSFGIGSTGGASSGKPKASSGIKLKIKPRKPMEAAEQIPRQVALPSTAAVPSHGLLPVSPLWAQHPALVEAKPSIQAPVRVSHKKGKSASALAAAQAAAAAAAAASASIPSVDFAAMGHPPPVASLITSRAAAPKGSKKGRARPSTAVPSQLVHIADHPAGGSKDAKNAPALGPPLDGQSQWQAPVYGQFEAQCVKIVEVGPYPIISPLQYRHGL